MTFINNFIFFSDKWAEHHNKIKELLKHMYMKCFTDNFGWCSAHLKKLKIKNYLTNVKLTAAHQYWGAPQCHAGLIIQPTNKYCIWLLFELVYLAHAGDAEPTGGGGEHGGLEGLQPVVGGAAQGVEGGQVSRGPAVPEQHRLVHFLHYESKLWI